MASLGGGCKGILTQVVSSVPSVIATMVFVSLLAKWGRLRVASSVPHLLLVLGMLLEAVWLLGGFPLRVLGREIVVDCV